MIDGLTVFAILIVVCIAALMLRKRPIEKAALLAGGGLQVIRRYSPSIETMLEYKDVKGTKTLRKVNVTAALQGRNGALYLRGRCHFRKGIRTFRADRILTFATTDGEVVDAREFLGNKLHLRLQA